MKIRIINDPDYDELVALLHESFKERLEQNLNFACATFTSEEFRRKLSRNSVIFGAFDDNHILLGMVVLNQIRKKNFGGCTIRYANHEYLAIASNAKGRGIATALLQEVKKYARKNNLDFILSDTADKADSSIKYHKKNGFKIYSKSHYAGRKYNSYNFILPISFYGVLLSIIPFKYILQK